jgi:hypothetical protein
MTQKSGVDTDLFIRFYQTFLRHPRSIFCFQAEE